MLNVASLADYKRTQLSARPLISIITPVYNESETLDGYYSRLTDVIDRLSSQYEFEIIITDNHSSDDTFAKAEQLAAKDPRVRAYRFSRNFGYQRSIWTGYALSKGDAALELDADLQDPPELLPEFLSAWHDGADIVYGIRSKRSEGWFNQNLRKLYYRLIRSLSDDDLRNDVGDFMLLDRRVVQHIRNTYDPNIYIRGLVFSLGYNRHGIAYQRSERRAGRSKFPLSKMIRLGLDGIVRHSTVPLRLASYLGILFSISAFLLGIAYVIAKLYFTVDWPAGFTTIVVVQLLALGITSTQLGIIGEYLARQYVRQTGAPMTIIERESSYSANLPQEQADMSHAGGNNVAQS